MSKPITPREAKIASINDIPSFVIDSFNKLITKNMQGRYSVVKQDDVVKEIMTKCSLHTQMFSRNDIYERNWLDIEDLYKKAGWIVVYYKPGYNESYAATFSFTAPEGFDACIDITA